MNILPLLFLGLILSGEKFSSLKELLAKIDFPSFAPVFQILGVDKKVVDFLSSENFSNALSSSDLKSLIPLFAPLLSKQQEEKEDTLEKTPNDYLSPIKNVAPTEVGANIESFLN